MNQLIDDQKKEENNYETIDLSKAIMDKIKSGGIKMKSRWIFYAQNLGIRSGLVLVIIALSLLINIFLYILQQNHALEFLDFGVAGLNIVLSNIPYDLTLLILIFGVASNVVLKKIEIENKKYFFFISVIVIAISTACGIIVFSTGINDTISEKIAKEKERIPVVDRFYEQKRFELDPQNSLIGQVVQFKVIQEPFVVVTNNGELVTVLYNTKLIVPGGVNSFDIGQIIKAIGQREQNNFKAEQIKLISNTDSFSPSFAPVSLTTVEVQMER